MPEGRLRDYIQKDNIPCCLVTAFRVVHPRRSSLRPLTAVQHKPGPCTGWPMIMNMPSVGDGKEQ